LAKYVLFGVRRDDVLVALATVRPMSVTGGKRVLLIAEWMSNKEVPFTYLLSNILDASKDWELDVTSLYAGSSAHEAKESRRCFFLRRGRVPIILADTAEGYELNSIKDHLFFYLGSTGAV